MKLFFVDKYSEGDADAQIVAMRKHFEFTDLYSADAIYCASIDRMNKALSAKYSYKIPLVVYCWDYYSWARASKYTSWSWDQYAGFLREADLIIVPSEGQRIALKDLLNLDSVVVRSGAPTYELPITDGGFILDPLRYYHADPNWNWAELAAEKLGIPIIHSEHAYSQEEFRKLVASCTFMTSCVREASTGGLSLVEGLWLGKPSLVSDGRYMGARDYVGDFGVYFKVDNFNDLVVKMDKMWKDRKQLDLKRVREHITRYTSYDSMALGLKEAICKLQF